MVLQILYPYGFIILFWGVHIGGKKVSKRIIEDVINDTLSGEGQKNALGFAAYLRTNERPLEESENYWEIKHKGDPLCFLWVDGSDKKPGPWTIWSSGEYADFPVDEHIKEIAWANVNPCGSCGGDCSSGKRKTIFGKEFDNLCNSAMAFTNPDAVALECAKKLVQVRLSDH